MTDDTRIKFEDLEALVKTKDYHYDSTLTICVVTLENGYKLTGISACADPANYNLELGQELAYKDALNKLWPILGYIMRDKLYQISKAESPTKEVMNTYIGTKVVHAEPMTRKEYNDFRGWELPKDENGDDEGYLVEDPDNDSQLDGYKGYLSWLPKDVFENTYGKGSPVPKTNFKIRLKKEYDELVNRRNKLHTFIHADKFLVLDEEDRIDLLEQYKSMTEYKEILQKRINKILRS